MCVRRRGVCVALALVGMMLASAAWGVYEREFISQEDFRAGIAEGLGFTSGLGGLSLNNCTNSVPHLWAPCPGDGVVCKIDARTGFELGRYRIGPAGANWSPCAVASDDKGNAYVACSGSGGRIVMILADGGIDRDNNGKTSTSGDYDGNHQIGPLETLPWVNDERVATVCEVGSDPSSLAFDPQGFLWITLRSECKAIKLDTRTGAIVGATPVVGKPSRIMMGQSNSLWVLSRENSALSEIDLLTGALKRYFSLENCDAAGMCVDSDGKVWIANLAGGLITLDPTKGTMTGYAGDDGVGCAGLAVDSSGDIWAGIPSTGEVARFSRFDGSLMAAIGLGWPVESLTADHDGYIWALSERAGLAMRINTMANKCVATAPTAIGPFSSTPFAAVTTDDGYLPNGCWRTVLDSKIDGAGWGRVYWNGIETGGTVTVEVRTSDSLETLPVAPFQIVMNGIGFTESNGRYMELRATMRSSGYATPVLYGLRIEGRNLAPNLRDAVATAPIIGKHDHTMESVSVMGIKDPEGDPFEVAITGVTQDEPVLGLGPGDKSPDAIGVGGSSVWLRGERDEGTQDKPGNGRVYWVSFKATDALGAISTGRVKVQVPLTIKTTDVAIDDKDHYDSTKDLFRNMAKAE
ncbi:MAG: hypothetical protein M1133_12020 [Armatimonadetes bacterium]|nr:hypothetical protein [Armatimonadota bacterium]